MNLRTQAIKLGLGALALGLCAVAQAAAPVITNITMAGTAPKFSVLSDTGVNNQIQYCTNLNRTNWDVLATFPVTQSPYQYVHTAGATSAACRFYRVMSWDTNVVTPTNMVLIPAGSFTMGNCMVTDEGNIYELPLHSVYVSAFYMDKYHVTKALWDDVYMWATNHGYNFDNRGSGKATNHPVVLVNWYDCVKWCNARSEREGKTPAYYTNATKTTGVYRMGDVTLTNTWVKWTDGYRLPTEAEWEKAARGGVSGHRFPWSDADTISWSQANYYANPAAKPYDINATNGYNPVFTNGVTPYTSPVGYFPPNGYGLYDMAGNAWAWCWDWYSDGWALGIDLWTTNSQTDPRGLSADKGAYHVVRGGTWYGGAWGCRTACRGIGNWTGSPTNSSSYAGFRSVLLPNE